MPPLENFWVDKNTPVPIYYQLKKRMLQMIEEGTLKVGDMLPTEMELCNYLEISRPTVRQAFSELVAEGRLTRQKGKGTFVARPKIDARFFQQLESYDDEIRQKGMVPSTRVLDCSVAEGEKHINTLLELAPGDKLIHLERLRFADGEPIVYLETWLSYGRFGSLLGVNLETHSLYQQMEALHGVRVARVAREIEAINADAATAKLLQIKEGKALCRVTTVGSTDRGEPVEYSVARYRGDRNKFHVGLSR